MKIKCIHTGVNNPLTLNKIYHVQDYFNKTKLYMIYNDNNTLEVYSELLFEVVEGKNKED